MNDQNGLQQAVFGGGCFWCTEAVFRELKGVAQVESGYSGGSPETANYEAVCSGTTQHAEVIRITFDPEKISFSELLDVFWATHDPTTPNRQGNDRGPQYRSVVFYMDAGQQQLALQSKDQVASRIWDAPIVTEISPFQTFFPAEDYHQDYYEKVGDRNPYCSFIITPKVSKFRKQFADKLK